MVDIDPQWVERRNENINSQVELETVDQKWLVDVLLNDVLFIQGMGLLDRLPRDKNPLALATALRLANESCFLFRPRKY